MTKIIKLIGLANKGSYGLVEVLLDDGTEASVYVGGDCEVFFDKGKVKAYVKRNKTIDITVNMEYTEGVNKEQHNEQPNI